MLPLEDRELLNQTMVGLNIDPETISSLMSSFDKAAEGLEADPIAQVHSASFGDSYTGGYRLGTNAEMAHEAVAEELEADRRRAARHGHLRRGVRQGHGVARPSRRLATMNLFEASTECVAAPDLQPEHMHAADRERGLSRDQGTPPPRPRPVPRLAAEGVIKNAGRDWKRRPHELQTLARRSSVAASRPSSASASRPSPAPRCARAWRSRPAR